MRTSIALVMSLLLCAVVATAEAAATDREKLQKKLAKVAPPEGAKPKVLCACSSDTPGFENRVGFVQQYVQSNQVRVQCAGSAFDVDGNTFGGFICSDFYLLTK